MDLSGGLGGLGALMNGPGPAFVGACRQEGDESQKGIAAADQPVQSGFHQAQLLHEHGLLLRVVQLGDVRLQLGGDGQHLAALPACQLLDLPEVGTCLRLIYLALGEVGGVNGFLQGEKVGGGDESPVIVGAVIGPGQVSLIQVGQEPLEYLHLVKEPLVPALGRLLGLVHPAGDHFRIG